MVKLVERLRDAITRYEVSEERSVALNTTYAAGQVSQQQAIYDKITDLTVRTFLLSLSFTLMIGPAVKSSFNTLLRLHEVTWISELVAIFADARTEVHAIEGQAGFRYGTARSDALARQQRRALEWKQARTTGEAVRVCSESTIIYRRAHFLLAL